MGFAIGKGASRRLLCREEKLEQVKNEEKRKYNDKNQSSTSAQEAQGVQVFSSNYFTYFFNKFLVPGLTECNDCREICRNTLHMIAE